MKVQLQSGQVVGHGIGTDGAPSMDADFARVMFGVTCHVIDDSGTLGRSIDPQWVTAGPDWVAAWHALSEQRLADEAASWASAFAPCEALTSRDPGRAS